MSFDCALSAFHAHPWSTDAEFQSGLSALVPAGRPAAERDELVLRAQCFYYARCAPLSPSPSPTPRNTKTDQSDGPPLTQCETNHRKFATHVDPDEYKAWLFRRQARPAASVGTDSTGPGSAAVSLHSDAAAAAETPSPASVPARPCGPDEFRLSTCRVPLVPSAAAAAASASAAGLPALDRAPPIADGPPKEEEGEGGRGPQLGYAELVELIREGKDVPGVREVPDTVLAGQGTESVAARRAKPWEVGRSAATGGAAEGA